MNCAVQHVDLHNQTSNTAQLRSADITINPTAGTYKIRSSALEASIDYGPSNAGTAWWDKGEYYMNDSLTYERFYFKGHSGFGIASLPVTPKPSFVKFLNNSYDTRDDGYFSQWCLGGIQTRYEDIPASTTFISSQMKLIRGGFRNNKDLSQRPHDFTDSSITISMTKADNRVALSMTLFGDEDTLAATPPTVTETVTGTGTIDPATGRFAGTLDAGAEGAGSMFRGALYGPTGSEIGLTVFGYRAGSTDPYRASYVLAAAGAH
jgi:hypothetical protein